MPKKYNKPDLTAPRYRPKKLNFTISQSKLALAEPFLKKQLISETHFIIPHNDGEAKRATDILQAIRAPHLEVSQQK